MILSISGNQTVESETDLILVNKLNEVISEVNNIEAKLQSTSSTNKSSFQFPELEEAIPLICPGVEADHDTFYVSGATDMYNFLVGNKKR